LMEVRAAYSKTDFEWDQLQRLSVESIQKSNLQLMREAATASLQATTAAAGAVAVSTTAAEAVKGQDPPATAATTQEQQQVIEEDQQVQAATSAPAAGESTSEAQLSQASSPAGNSSSNSSVACGSALGEGEQCICAVLVHGNIYQCSHVARVQQQLSICKSRPT
jgi:hypothetical protein